jgi:hypothetical protein
MIPVDQTILGHPGGNCFTACMASILEMPIEELPHYQSENWCDLWDQWLAPFNLRLFFFIYDPRVEMPNCYSILSGTSPRGDWLHAVVCFGNEIVHDPHPDKTGVVDRLEFTIFSVLDPARPIGRAAA